MVDFPVLGFSEFEMGSFRGDAFAALCISMAGLYMIPHLVSIRQLNLHQNLTVTHLQ
jgi:hypothetical protein